MIDDGDGHYTFAHALIEDTLYDSLTPARRARLHRAAAEALEELEPGRPAAGRDRVPLLPRTADG